MLILSRFFLFHYFHGYKKPYKDTFFAFYSKKKLGIYLVETNIYCTFATAIERDSDGKMKSWCVSSVG